MGFAVLIAMLVTSALVPVEPVNPVPVLVGKNFVWVCPTELPYSCSMGRDWTMESLYARSMRSCKRFQGGEVGKTFRSEDGFDLC